MTEALEKIPGVKPGSVLSLMSPRVKDVHSTDDALEITPLAGKVPANDAEIAAFRERVQGERVPHQPVRQRRRPRRPRCWSTSTTS